MLQVAFCYFAEHICTAFKLLVSWCGVFCVFCTVQHALELLVSWSGDAPVGRKTEYAALRLPGSTALLFRLELRHFFLTFAFSVCFGLGEHSDCKGLTKYVSQDALLHQCCCVAGNVLFVSLLFCFHFQMCFCLYLDLDAPVG